MIDWTGKILSKPFAAEIDFSHLSNRPLVQYKEEKNGLYGLAKLDGTILTKPFAESIHLNDDKKIATFSIDRGKDTLYGTVDTVTGDIKQEAFATTIEEMNDQLSYYMTEKNNEKGLLSADGTILKKNFTRFFGWREEQNLDSESTDSEEELFDENGLTCFEEPKTALLGLMDKNGTIVKEPFAAYINHYSDGLAVFLQEDKETDQFLYGFMDKNGNIIKEPFATAMSSFNNGVAWFEDPASGKGGLINKQGQIIRKPFAFGGTQFADSGIATFSLTDNGKNGIINTEGEILKNPFAFEFASINRSYEIYKYKENENDLYGLIDSQGTIIKEPFAYQIESETPQKASQKLVTFTESEDGLWGILNDQGQIVKEPFAYKIISFAGTQNVLGFCLEEKGPIGLIDQEGTIIRPPSLTFIKELNSDKNQPLRYIYEEKETHLEGLMDEQLQPITEPFAATIGLYEGGFSKERIASAAMPYKVYTEGNEPNNHGLITPNGKILQQPFATKIETFNEDGIASFLYDEKGITKAGLVNEKGVIIEK
ncbi:WG repeat-containing protein [Enterococcus crotali]|uniref:WG repeat-containing protein n=1 Tax=Enterococcus crotali TaxID=1453587 RepID=UPI0004724D11|nr:WG repeat-containing protein [Enterococcus crotali]